jgi:UDP-galactopyranose mutase
MKQYDFIIIGCGFWGSVFAQQALEAGKTVLLLDKRDHIGGNCYSYSLEDSPIIIHRYGTHIFHTRDREIWNYVQRFTEFNRYQHRVLALHKNRVYSMPINLGTINAFFQVNLKPGEVQEFLSARKTPVEAPLNFEEKAIAQVGQELYDAFFKNYTIKQWGCDPRELPADIFSRLPVRESFFDSYYDDPYQGLPIEGYTPVFQRMLEGADLQLNVDFLEDRSYWERHCNRLVYTGPLDKFFENRYGLLTWRSIRLETEEKDIGDYQGTSVLNYTDSDVPFTRIHEPRHLHREKGYPSNMTVIMKEYALDDDEWPYYPVNFSSDREKAAHYRELAGKEKNVIFGGRLAEYRYLDMDQVIGSALRAAKRILG